MKKISIGQYVILLILTLFALACIIPLILVIIASFSSEKSLNLNGFTFFPDEWSLDAWLYVLGYGKQLVTSYGVTIFITLLGSVSSLFIVSMFAYALARKTFVLRSFLSTMLLITMLFGGGQLSSYLVNTTMYHLTDTFLVLWMPTVATMHVIIIRTYIQTNITDSVIESAKIDGAGEFRIYAQIVMPLLPPVLATVGFMLVNAYWNAWQDAMLYIRTLSKTPLQLLLMRIEKDIEMINNQNVPAGYAALLAETLPEKAARMAMLLTVLGPVLIAYPFFQKYFIKGMTVGAVKG